MADGIPEESMNFIVETIIAALTAVIDDIFLVFLGECWDVFIRTLSSMSIILLFSFVLVVILKVFNDKFVVG